MKKSKFTEEQIVRILEEAERGDKTRVQICKDHGVNLNTFYIWRRKYAGMQTQDLRQLRELESSLPKSATHYSGHPSSHSAEAPRDLFSKVHPSADHPSTEFSV